MRQLKSDKWKSECFKVQMTGALDTGTPSNASKSLSGLSEHKRRCLALKEGLLSFPGKDEVIHHHGGQGRGLDSKRLCLMWAVWLLQKHYPGRWIQLSLPCKLIAEWVIRSCMYFRLCLSWFLDPHSFQGLIRTWPPREVLGWQFLLVSESGRVF